MARTSTCEEEGPRRHNLQQNPQRQYPQNNKRALQIISYKFPHSRAISGGLGGARLANSRQNSHHRAPLPFKCPRRVVPAPSTSCRKCQPLGSYRRAFTMCIKWCLYGGLRGAIAGPSVKFDPWRFYAALLIFFIMILFHILFTFPFNLFILISHLFSFSPSLFLPLPLSLFPAHSPSLSFSLPHSLSLSLIHPHRLLYLPQPSLIRSGNDPLFRGCSHPVTLSIGSGGGVGVGATGINLHPHHTF